MKKRDRENLNPTAEAVIAMNLWCDEYGAQRGGSMDFYENISNERKRRCTELVDRVIAAAKAHGRLR